VLQAQPLAVQERWELERARIGFDEGAVMAEVARQWFFPDAMVDALRQCARPLYFLSFSPLGAVVHLAMLLADMEAVDEASLQTLPAELVSRLGLELPWMSLHIPDRASFTESKV
jgi:hypothetical protein